MEMPLRLMCYGKKERLEEKDFQRKTSYVSAKVEVPTIIASHFYYNYSNYSEKASAKNIFPQGFEIKSS